ncbi:MAG: hypothetical protein C4542_05215 [Dehalococcoidia bacterium]|nr:MAG: hypothetical protein C4542_05215 [Dehalococcoidia bacterium]
MKIVYVKVKNKTLPGDRNVEGWGVLVNGNLIATDSLQDFLTCGEITERLAQALNAPLENRIVEVSNKWNWVSDVLPKVGVSPEQPKHTPEGVLRSRLDALRNGDSKTDCFLNTIEEVLRLYIFITSYVAANRESADWPELAVEMLEDEDCWPENTDPDVLAAFEACRAREINYRRQRESERGGK